MTYLSLKSLYNRWKTKKWYQFF